MILFADASAIVAILMREPDYSALETILVRATDRLYSAIVEWETVAALSRGAPMEPADARPLVASFLRDLDFRLVVIGPDEASAALDAYQTYGKGRHPARLNMGDCFAYACARTNGAKLLYKGDDFARTDMA